MFRKNYFIFGNKFYTTIVLVVLTSCIIVSCSEKKESKFDPILPIAYCSYEVRYNTHTDGKMYAFVTVKNNSVYSNRWQWSRPGSEEEIQSGDTAFMTDKKNDFITVYPATDVEQSFTMTLIAYSDKPYVIPPDTTIYYKPYESEPFVQVIKVKKPEFDPNTLPLAEFSCDEIQYKTLVDTIKKDTTITIVENTYAFVTAKNNSSYSNRWKWYRPGSNGEKTGAMEFMTDRDSLVTQVYLALNFEQRFEITLTAYNYMLLGSNPDATNNYEVVESEPFMREVTVKSRNKFFLLPLQK